MSWGRLVGVGVGLGVLVGRIVGVCVLEGLTVALISGVFVLVGLAVFVGAVVALSVGSNVAVISNVAVGSDVLVGSGRTAAIALVGVGGWEEALNALLRAKSVISDTATRPTAATTNLKEEERLFCINKMT